VNDVTIYWLAEKFIKQSALVTDRSRPNVSDYW